MAYRKGKRRLSMGRNRPAWSRRQALVRAAVVSLVVLAYQAVGTLLTLSSDTDGVSQIVVGFGGTVLALGAAWWLGSLHSGSLLVLAGAATLGIVGPIGVVDEMLAVDGHTIVATVSDVQISRSKNNLVYTVRFTGVERPMIVYNPQPPISSHEQLRVVVDPQGRVPTEEPESVAVGWPLPVAIGGALVMIGGFVLSASADQRMASGGWEHSWPYRVAFRRQERRRAARERT